MKKIFALLFTIVFVFSAGFASAGELENLGKKIHETLSIIEKLYYKEPTPEQNKAFTEGLESAVNDILSEHFDKYSNFVFTPRGKTLREELEGKYVGIGILIMPHPEDVVEAAKAYDELSKRLSHPDYNLQENDKKLEQEIVEKMSGGIVGERGLYVKQVFKNSGAYLAGVRRGWSITAVENEKGELRDVAGGKTTEAVRLITGAYLEKGSEDTAVKIKFRKPGGEEIVLHVLRKKITPETVWGEMKNDDVGYVQINSFGHDMTKDFELAVSELKKKGMKKLVIDVRNNPGGEVNAVDGVLDRLVSPGKVLLFMEARGRKEARMWSDKSVPVIFEGPIAVLINGNSASASEILAGVLKDHGLATLVGEKTFGKGVGQTASEFASGGEFVITTFEYILPVSGYKVNGKGIEPHIQAKNDPLTLEDEILDSALDFLKTKK